MRTMRFSPAAKAMAFVLAVLITVTGFNTGWAQAEDNSIDVDTKVTYDDSKSTAEITFDLEKVGKQGYETQQILDADGNKVFAIEKAEKALKTAKASNDAAAVKKAEKDMFSPISTVKKNGTYKYKIWDEYTVRLGDVDGDGYADSADGRIISQMDMGLIPSN